MRVHPVLINGSWVESNSSGTFRADNPSTREPIGQEFPVSTWADCDAALQAAAEAAVQLNKLPAQRIGSFLDRYADLLDANKDSLVASAHLETALPVAPRLGDVELPRTSNQLRQAATAAREGKWSMPTIDSSLNIRSCLGPIGPVAVFGPNNFPFAFNSVAGGDFAAAIAAGNPVIAKANSSHPETTRLCAKLAHQASQETGMPQGMIQLLYRTSHVDGERLVSDRRIGATGYTGSQNAGLKLKAAADAAGKPIYLELSSSNPVVILNGALEERGEELATEFAGSCLMGTGQFCTNPGVVMLVDGKAAQAFVAQVREKFDAAPVGTLLSESVQKSFASGLVVLQANGAKVVTQGKPSGQGYCQPNTLLTVTGDEFLSKPAAMQTEVFGNQSLMVLAKDIQQLKSIIDSLEGNLTGSIYSDTDGDDDQDHDLIEPSLRKRVGRLMNDKMPTGVAVSPAMNHGGPFPATGHPGFTAVGIPASLVRFGMLMCYDNVRPDRLPVRLQDKTPSEAI